MTKEKIFEELSSILKTRGFWNIEYDSLFDKDLGMDSLDIVEFSFDIEECFGINIPDEKLYSISSIKGMIEFIESEVQND